MDITEVPPDKKIVISKVEFVCDIIDESIPKPLPQTYNHFLILSAPLMLIVFIMLTMIAATSVFL